MLYEPPKDGSRDGFSPISCLFFSSVRAEGILNGLGSVLLDAPTNRYKLWRGESPRHHCYEGWEARVYSVWHIALPASLHSHDDYVGQ